MTEPIRIRVMSDLHTEFHDFAPEPVPADLVILAGDICPAYQLVPVVQAMHAFQEVPVIIVPGNHEYYGEELKDARAYMQLAAGQTERIHVLDGHFLDLTIRGQAVRIVGATLWTDFQLFGPDSTASAMQTASVYLNDFRLIRRMTQDGKVQRLSPAYTVELHDQALARVRAALQSASGAYRVVVTHHAPSKMSVPPRYAKDLLSSAFSSNLDELVGQADLWVHGHTHDSFDYRIGNCRVVCNPRGYPSGSTQENASFNPNLVIELI
jgi:predicted phosphodiesterase